MRRRADGTAPGRILGGPNALASAAPSVGAPSASASSPTPQASASSTAPPADVIAFTGLYDLVAGSKTGSPPRANWGRIVILQKGTDVYADYPGGELRCRAAGAALDCDWTEPKAKGKAALSKEPDGAIAGTWGQGESASDAGKWKLALLEKAGASWTEPILGLWESGWGDFELTGSGTSLVGKNERGDMHCEEVGPALDCTWYLRAPIVSPHFRSGNGSNPTVVRERFVRTSRGTLEGTWGVEGSSSGGGRWSMIQRPKKAPG